jgi:diguanylate cyclase (GGDEF)-like protein/PAS domain S-box-containing protein
MKLKQRAVSDILSENQEPTIDGIIVIDSKSTVLAFDSAAQNLFGYIDDEVVGQPIEMLMTNIQAKAHSKYLNNAAKKSGNEARKLHLERTIIGKHKSGHSIPLAITVSADHSTENMRFTGVIQDLRKHEDQQTKLFQNFEATTHALNQRIEFEELLNTHGNHLLSCSADRFYTTMEAALQAIAKYLSLDHGYILQLSENLSEASLWAEWRRSVSLMKPFPARFKIPNSQEFFQALSSSLSPNNTIVIEQDQDEKNKIIFHLAQQLSPNGFLSTRITPIFNDKGSLAGIIGFSVLDPHNKPTEAQLSLLNLAIQLIINAWGRHQLIIQANETEKKIQAKNKLLANKAAFSQTLLRASNSLFLSTRVNIQKNIEEVLIQAAQISGHQQALIYFEQDNQHHLESFIQQQLNTDPLTRNNHPELIQWVKNDFHQKDILQINDISKLQLSAELAFELKEHKIQGFTAVKLNRGNLLIGFLIFYNSLPMLNSNDENLRFLQLTGQNLSAAIQHHSIQYDLEISEQNLLSANRMLAKQALNDALTGLANRRAFDLGICQEFDRAQRHNGNLTVLMCDIDYFKYYNDHYGHPQGDVCLQHVAQMIQRTFNRAGELCTRYGGEEFAIVLPSINHQEAELQAQRLIDELVKSKIKQSPTAPLNYISLSIGIAQLSPQHHYSDYMTLINEADKALYQAKNNGRNQLAWATKAE